MALSTSANVGPLGQLALYRRLASEWTTKAMSVGAAGLTITNTIGQRKRVAPTPPGFVYVENEYIFDVDVDKPSADFIISCSCSDCQSGQCECIANSDITFFAQAPQIPYDIDNKLAIEIPRDLEVNECNKNCTCVTQSCQNRASQIGRSFVLDIFYKSDLTWGVRTVDPIPTKSILGVHTGLLVKRSKFFSDKDAVFCFNLDHDTVVPGPTPEAPTHNSFTVFSKDHGNWSRFLADSSSANLDTFMTVHDIPSGHGMPFITLFANKDIAPWTELTLNYHNNTAVGSTSTRRKKRDVRGDVDDVDL